MDLMMASFLHSPTGVNGSLKWVHDIANDTLDHDDSVETDSLLSEAGEDCPDEHVDSQGNHIKDENQARRNRLRAFTDTFCRREEARPLLDQTDVTFTGVKVYFLGLFDCVSSVKVLEGPFGKTPPPVSVVGTAEHVRHAVAMDERRVKFKPALLAQDHRHHSSKDEDIREVWFPGNHGDVGGGWPAPDPTLVGKQERWLDFVKRVFTGDRPGNAPDDNWTDPYQMSDVALHWMINEVKNVGALEKGSALRWSRRLKGFEENFNHKKSQAFTAPAHDTLRILGGLGLVKVMLWKAMEALPFIGRWEIDEKYQFCYQRIWPNNGHPRDIPHDAIFHNFVKQRMTMYQDYRPRNHRGGHKEHCLADPSVLYEIKPNAGEKVHRHHTLFTLNKPS